MNAIKESTKQTRFYLFRMILTLCLYIPSVYTHAVTIDFSAFPGADNMLGTADDIPVSESSLKGVFFTNEYAHLMGGIGFVVDSAVGGNSSSGYYSNLGAIVNAGRPPYSNVLVAAAPELGPGEIYFGALRYRFVDSVDGTTPVAVPSIGFDFVPGVAPGFTDTARFYDLAGNLLTTITYVDGVGNNHVSYSNPAGFSRVEIDTNFSVTTDNVTFSIPEPSSLALIGSGIVSLIRSRRRKANLGVFAQTDKNSHRNLSVFAAGPEKLFTVGRGSFRA